MTGYGRSGGVFMIIVVPREVRPSEYRVGLTPAGTDARRARVLPGADSRLVPPSGRGLAGPACRPAAGRDDGHHLRDDPGGRRLLPRPPSHPRGGRAPGG